MRRGIAFIVLTLLILSFVFEKKTVNSSELTTITSKSGNQITTSYVDDKGKITFAGDKGYACIRRTYEDSHVILEEYLDAKGKPVVLSNGYSALSRSYEGGLNTIITYLDKNLKCVVTALGYDSIRRSYNSSRLADTDTYWIGGEQVERSSGYWQYKRGYDDQRRINEIRYEDKNGALSTSTTFGYSLIKRSYTKNKGRIDFYFDYHLNPVTGSLGQYGVKVEGNSTTYLDRMGYPMNTLRGYATVVKDGSKTLYYNKEGSPVTIGRSQYGVQSVNGQSVYLDENGEMMFRLDNILNTHPYAVIVIALILTCTAITLRGRAKAAFIVLYILAIIYMTMWYRESGDSRGALTLFWSYKQFLRNAPLRQTIINNIWLFVPLGAALFSPGHPWRWLWCVGLSIAIEAIQWTAGIGLAELDDVVSNGIGAMTGAGIAWAMLSFKEERCNRL